MRCLIMSSHEVNQGEDDNKDEGDDDKKDEN